MKHRTGSVMLCYEVWTHISSTPFIVVVTVFLETVIRRFQEKQYKKPHLSLQIFHCLVSC